MVFYHNIFNPLAVNKYVAPGASHARLSLLEMLLRAFAVPEPASPKPSNNS